MAPAAAVQIAGAATEDATEDAVLMARNGSIEAWTTGFNLLSGGTFVSSPLLCARVGAKTKGITKHVTPASRLCSQCGRPSAHHPGAPGKRPRPHLLAALGRRHPGGMLGETWRNSEPYISPRRRAGSPAGSDPKRLSSCSLTGRDTLYALAALGGGRIAAGRSEGTVQVAHSADSEPKGLTSSGVSLRGQPATGRVDGVSSRDSRASSSYGFL